MKNAVSRRQFLQSTTILAASGLISACVMPATDQTTASTGESGAATTEPQVIQLAIGLSPENEALISEMIAAFEDEHGDVSVATAELPPYVGFFEKMVTQIAAGEAPDVASVLAYWAAVLGKADILLPLDDLLTANAADTYDASLLKYCQWEGVTHGLPMNSNIQGIIFNQTHFDVAGITPPASPEDAWTWTDFSEICQQLKQANELEFAYGIYGGAPQGRLIQVYQNGRAIVAEDLTHSELDTEEAIDALLHIQRLFAEGFVPAEAWSASDPRFGGTEMFKAQQIPMFHGGQWHIPWGKENITFDWGVTYLQQQAQLTTVPGGDAYVVFHDTAVPNQAAALAEFLTNAENQQVWNSANYKVPSHRSLLEPGAITFPDHQEKMALFVDQLRFASQRMLTEYYADGWSKTDAMLRQRTSELATQQMEAGEWATDIAEVIRGFIAEGGF